MSISFNPERPLRRIGKIAASKDNVETYILPAVINWKIDSDPRGLAGSNLFRTEASELIATHATLFPAFDSEGLLAFCATKRDNGGKVSIKSVVKVRGDGLGPRLSVAAAIVFEANRGSIGSDFSAEIREYPEGFRDRLGNAVTGNLPSQDIFKGFEFRISEPEPRTIVGDLRDRHLVDGAEIGGRTYRLRLAVGTEGTVEAARRFIAAVGGES